MHSSSPAHLPRRASYQSGSCPATPFALSSTALPRLTRLPGSPRRPHQRLPRPILPSPDSMPHRILPLSYLRLRSQVASAGTRCARCAQAPGPELSPPARSNPSPKSSSHPPPRCLTGTELHNSLNATQCWCCGQATESFKVFGYAETAKSFVWRSHGSPCSRYNSLVPPVTQSVRVKVLFFGRLKDVVGHAEDSLDFAEASTIEQLFAFYSARVPELAKYRSSVVASR